MKYKIGDKVEILKGCELNGIPHSFIGIIVILTDIVAEFCYFKDFDNFEWIISNKYIRHANKLPEELFIL